VRACEVCDRERVPNPAPRAPLGHLPADQPFAALYIDIVGGQNSLSLGASPKSILTMIDGLTGWAEAVPIADQTAVTVARVVYAEWIARYGVPEQLHSDRGVQFESAVFAELCDTFGVDKTRTTPYRPQANGKCERFNRTLVAMLRRAVMKRPFDWEPLLPAVLQAYRSSVTESTGFTPFRLTFGREMRLPIDLGTPTPDPPREIRTFAADLAEDLEWSYRVAREVIGLGHRRAESRYNERIVARQYKPGVLVRALVHTHPHGVPSKLNAKYSGLCEVLEVRGPTLTLRELDTQRVFTASHDAVRASTLPPRAPQAPVPLANSQPRNSQLDDNRENRVDIADEAIEERKFEAIAETNAAETDGLTANRESQRDVPSLLDLEIPMPAALRAAQSQSPLPTRPRRNTRRPIRFESSQSSAGSMHDRENSDSSLLVQTPRSQAPHFEASRRDSNCVLDAVRKKPSAVMRITSAASKLHARPIVSRIANEQRGTQTQRVVNCCAMLSRKAPPPVSLCTPPPQSAECTVSSGNQRASDDRRDPSVFTFEPCAIAAFAHELSERETRGAMMRNCATRQVQARHESIGRALFAETASALAAHIPLELRVHINAHAPHDSQSSLRLSAAKKNLRSRRLARLFSRSLTPNPSSSNPPITAHSDSRTAHTDSFTRGAPESRSIPIAAISANAVTPPMNPRDSSEIFNSAAYGFGDFGSACEALRGCDEADLIVRGPCASTRRDAASSNTIAIRELLRVHFAKFSEVLRTLFEFAIIEIREATQGLSLTETGQPEVFELGRVRVRSYHAALTIAEVIRREYSARPANERPQFLIVAHDETRPAETVSLTQRSREQPERARTTTTGSTPPLAGTPPDSGNASSSEWRPPFAPLPPIPPPSLAPPPLLDSPLTSPAISGAESSAPPLSFRTAKAAAEAAAAAAAIAESNAERRAEEAAQRVYSPRPFAAGTLSPWTTPIESRPIAAPPSTAAHPEPPESPAPSRFSLRHRRPPRTRSRRRVRLPLAPSPHRRRLPRTRSRRRARLPLAPPPRRR
jgi:hypothetical protein